jgi:hypothetical protein
MKGAHLGAPYVPEFLTKDEADKHFSDTHSEEKTSAME